MHDLVIDDAKVVDGTGAPARVRPPGARAASLRGFAMRTLRVIAVATALLAPTVAAVGAEPKSLAVTVVGSDRGDPRRAVVEEAVEFWNRQLESVGADIRLGPTTQVIESVPDVALRRMSEAMLRGRPERDLPGELQNVPGDIIVAFSNGDFVSFAMRWTRDRKGLVALRSAHDRPLSLPNVLRNVIAHELGHVLGLRHNDDATTLMCGRPAPCRPGEFISDEPRFFPLTDADKANLQRAQ